MSGKITISDLSEALYLSCWKIDWKDRAYFVKFFDKENKYYVYTVIDGYQFAEGEYYLVLPGEKKLKIGKNGKPYISLSGLQILTKLTWRQYKNELPAPKWKPGEKILLKHKQGSIDLSLLCLVEGIIYNNDYDFWEYSVLQAELPRDENGEYILLKRIHFTEEELSSICEDKVV